jgi:hypothetical protein
MTRIEKIIARYVLRSPSAMNNQMITLPVHHEVHEGGKKSGIYVIEIVWIDK